MYRFKEYEMRGGSSMLDSSQEPRIYYSQTPDFFSRRQIVPFDDLYGPNDTASGSVDLISPITQEFLSYWTSLYTQAGGVPFRHSFKPGCVRRTLPYILLLERYDGEFRVRLSGTEADHVIGFVGAGHMLKELPEPIYTRWNPIFTTVHDTKKPHLFRHSALGASANVEIEAVTVPFLHKEAAAGPEQPASVLVMTAFDIFSTKT